MRIFKVCVCLTSTLCMLFLIACGSVSNSSEPLETAEISEPSPTLVVTTTPKPTSTENQEPKPTPTNTLAVTDTPAFTHYNTETDDMREEMGDAITDFSIQYPSDWQAGWVSDSGIVAYLIAPDLGAAWSSRDYSAPDVFIFPAQYPSEGTPIDAIVDSIDRFENSEIVEEPSTVVVNGFEMVRAEFIDIHEEFNIIAIAFNGFNGVSIWIRYPVEQEQETRPLIEAILNSLELPESEPIPPSPTPTPIPELSSLFFKSLEVDVSDEIILDLYLYYSQNLSELILGTYGLEGSQIIYWDTETWELSGEFFRPDARFYYSRAISPDGSLLAFETQDTIDIWQTDTKTLQSTIHDVPAQISALAFSQNDMLVVFGYEENEIQLEIWDVQSITQVEKQIKPFPEPLGGASSFVISNNGNLIAFEKEQVSYIWDIEDNTITEIGSVLVETYDKLFSDDNQMIAIGGVDSVRVAYTNTGEEAFFLEPQQGSILALAFSSDNKILATSGAGDNHSIMLWDLVTGDLIETIYGHHVLLDALAFSPDGNFLVSIGYEQDLLEFFVWDLSPIR